MADLTGITAVRPTETTRIQVVTYGATISAGQPLYLDTTDNEYKLADASVQATAVVRAIAMTPGIDGGFGVVATSGPIILVGTTMVVGESYICSDTAGGIMPNGDATTNDYVTDIGRASTATQLDLDINATGIQAA